MPRGRPRKIKNENTILKENTIMDKQAHVVVRYLSRLNRSNPMTGEISGDDLDALLSGWIEKGFKLSQAVHLGDNPEGHGMVFVFVKEA